MSRYLFALASFLVLAAGCRHASVPTLPASHGHLSLALDKYLELPSEGPSAPTPVGTPEVVVEPAQAPSVFAGAVQVLRGKPTEQELHQASADLGAACDAPFQPACDFLREQFKGPKKIVGDVPEYPREAISERAFAIVVVRCRLGVDGSLRACEVLEAAPYGFTEAVVEGVDEDSGSRPILPSMRYRTANQSTSGSILGRGCVAAHCRQRLASVKRCFGSMETGWRLPSPSITRPFQSGNARYRTLVKSVSST